MEPIEDHDCEKCHSGIHPVCAELSCFPGIMPDGLTAQEFVTVNDDIEATAALNDHDIVANVKRILVQNNSDSEVEDIPIQSVREALAALDVPCRFCCNIEGSRLGALECADKVSQAVAAYIAKQKIKLFK